MKTSHMQCRNTAGRTRLHRTLCLAIVVIAAACDGEDASAEQDYVPLVHFDTATAHIITATDTFQLTVEIAEREGQRAYGLMERTSLPADAGMIFLYNSRQSGDAGFWMYRTRIPLDIAYLDQDGVIVAILSMEPCPDADPRGCPYYPPGVPYYSALEVNRGYFAERGIGVGARVVLHR